MKKYEDIVYAWGGQKGFGRTQVNVVSLKGRIETKKDGKEADFFLDISSKSEQSCLCVRVYTTWEYKFFQGPSLPFKERREKKVQLKKGREIDYRVYYTYIYIYIAGGKNCVAVLPLIETSWVSHFFRRNVPFCDGLSPLLAMNLWRQVRANDIWRVNQTTDDAISLSSTGIS